MVPHAVPIERFRTQLRHAEADGVPLPIAMALATASADGTPSVRMVLLRGLDERGFVFFTNLESRKGRELRTTPTAALCFWWPPREEQVRVEGSVEQVDDAESDAYWARAHVAAGWRPQPRLRAPRWPVAKNISGKSRRSTDVMPAGKSRVRANGRGFASSRTASNSGMATPIVCTNAYSIRAAATAGKHRCYIRSSVSSYRTVSRVSARQVLEGYPRKMKANGLV